MRRRQRLPFTRDFLIGFGIGVALAIIAAVVVTINQRFSKSATPTPSALAR